MYDRWNNVMSSGFKVTNGVRQGGILSPYLFCVYADELSRMLNNVNAGCFVGASLVNHLMYADDLVLLAPSAAGLPLLLYACSYYQIYAQGNALARKFYMCTETVRISLLKSYCSSLYTSSLWCNYRSESLRKLCVAYNNMFLDKLPFCLETAVPVSCLPRVICQHVNFLIRKHAYIFMKSVAESRNVILHSIVRSDSLFTSPLWQHWINLLYVHPF